MTGFRDSFGRVLWARSWDTQRGHKAWFTEDAEGWRYRVSPQPAGGHVVDVFDLVSIRIDRPEPGGVYDTEGEAFLAVERHIMEAAA
ncbi:MAG: hypothetical protein AAGI54_08155 [Planctomycetota bacterium]